MPPEAPTRWLMKNTDTFAGFAHAINSYLAGVALAARHGVGLIHRPQIMAHGLGFTFVDFLDSDPRGIMPPVYAPLLQTNASSMLINRHPTRLSFLLAAGAQNVSAAAERLDAMPPHTLLWLRKGRAVFSEPSSGCHATASDEVCYGALWLRERFWRAVLLKRLRAQAGLEVPSAPRGRQRHGKAQVQVLPSAAGAASMSASQHAVDGGPIRICVHVRRGDVYYLGPKTRMPHPHWVETVTVLDLVAGVRRAIGMPLEAPAVLVDVFTEVGWLRNDTEALHALAPHAVVHLDSSPAATLNALVQMSQADLLVMGSSGFSFWAGIFSCGVKIGFVRANSAPLPMRFVKYASTITKRTAPFWPSAGAALQAEWAEYWRCRRDPACRPSLCEARHVAPGIWTRSVLGRQAVADARAVQWRLPELIMWPVESARVEPTVHAESPALGELRSTCSAIDRKGRAKVAPSEPAAKLKLTAARLRGFGHTSCLRNVWLHNLTQFLAARKHKSPAGAG